MAWVMVMMQGAGILQRAGGSWPFLGRDHSVHLAPGDHPQPPGILKTKHLFEHLCTSSLVLFVVYSENWACQQRISRPVMSAYSNLLISFNAGDEPQKAEKHQQEDRLWWVVLFSHSSCYCYWQTPGQNPTNSLTFPKYVWKMISSLPFGVIHSKWSLQVLS